MNTRSDPALDAILEGFLTPCENGESPTPNAYLARHPTIAKELAGFFDDLTFVESKLADVRGSFRTGARS